MKRQLIVFFLCCCATVLQAQTTVDQRNVYNDAESAYNIGRLELAQDLLTQNINSFSGTIKQSAYRLLALVSLALDQEEEAERYVGLLLRENPYYSTVADDLQRFTDMVERVKSGMTATISTASSQAENLNETPVPVTLITEEMIRNCGAQNLKDVLMAYVPGMTDVDCNDDINIAMRSMYSSNQEKMLFLLDGHRLNSFTNNSSSPDFSLSLEKVKQIEVLRGPASSLYGGVALSAVVNIITKQGADVDGFKVKAGLGNYGQLRGDVLFGKRYFDLDVLVWASAYKAKGEQRYMSINDTGLKLKGGDVTVGGIGNMPSYDLGISLNWNGLSFLYNTHFSQVISPLTYRYTSSPYDYDKYTTFRGMSPSFSVRSHHLDVGYSKTLGNFYLNGRVSLDKNDMTQYNVITDEKASNLGPYIGISKFGEMDVDSILSYFNGIYRYIDGQDRTIGVQLKGDYTYQLGSNHHGLVSFGMEYSNYKLLDARYVLGVNYNAILTDLEQIMENAIGEEHSYDAFAQLKHTWGNLILNAGLRYDFKKRYDKSTINEISPRVALIFLQPKWNAKLSYSRSFVDAPYFHRKTNELMMGGFVALKPEKLNSFQLTFQWVNPVPGLMVEVNGFFNHSKDLIYANGYLHVNAEPSNAYGLEISSSYKTKRFFANFAVEVMRLDDAEYSSSEHMHRILNVPNFSTSTVLAWEAFKNFKLHSHITTYSAQSAYSIYWKDTIDFDEFDNPGRVLVDLGANYKVGRMELGVNIHNLFNKKYAQGGMNSNGLIPQKGTWVMADIAYTF